MNTWSTLWTKVSLAAHAFFAGWLVDERPHQPTSQATAAELEQIRSRLNGLLPHLAALMNWQRQIEFQQRRATEMLQSLESQIDDAVRQKNDELARALLQRREELRLHCEDLQRQWTEQAQIVAETRAVLESLHSRMLEAQQRQAVLTAREQSALSLESVARTRRELERDLAHLQAGLDQREAAAARREDTAAVLKDIHRTGAGPRNLSNHSG